MNNFIHYLASISGFDSITVALLVGGIVGLVLGRITRANPEAKVSGGAFSSSMKVSLSQLDSPSHIAFQNNSSTKKVEIDSELSLKLKDLLNKNRKIDAIKLLREEKSLELVEAKQMVESLETAFKKIS